MPTDFIRHTAAAILLALFFNCTGAELPLSMRLESGMALERAMDFLLPLQKQDGSWENDTAVTAEVLCALISAGRDKGSPQCTSAFNFLENSFAAALGTGQIYAARALLKGGRKIPDFSVPDCQFPQDALAAAEVLVLTGRHTETALQLLAHAGSDPFFQAAATAMQTAHTTVRITSLDTEDFSRIYWASRAFAARPDFYTGNWKSAVMSGLFELQKADGAWGGTALPAKQRIINTALAIQSMVLCLE